MGLEQLELETGLNKVEVAIALLRAWEPLEGYYLAFSGGKDSVAIYDLAVKAGVKFDAHYCVSPIDPPQIYKFIKEYYPDVIWDYHARNFWKLVLKNDLPLRQQRWCCKYIKEAGGSGRFVIVGNRRAEGKGKGRRSKQCFTDVWKDKRYFRPIIEFTDYDVWQYIRENNLPVCELYQQGFSRIGCVLCPFHRNVEQEMLAFPKIVNNWKLACNRIVEDYKARGYLTKRGKPMKWKPQTGEEKYQRWVNRK